jgi:uncharacterized protein (DUF849 family)
VLHVHVRNPATGHLSTDSEQFNYLLGRLKQAVPKMILQVGGSISFAPKGEGQEGRADGLRHSALLAELNPKPESVTVAIGTCDAGPAFYLEHLKRLKKKGIQPYFPLARVHQLEIAERLIRKGVYLGPLNMAIGTYGGGGCGHNPFDSMEFIRRTPQGACASIWAGMRMNAVFQPMALARS